MGKVTKSKRVATKRGSAVGQSTAKSRGAGRAVDAPVAAASLSEVNPAAVPTGQVSGPSPTRAPTTKRATAKTRRAGRVAEASGTPSALQDNVPPEAPQVATVTSENTDITNLKSSVQAIERQLQDLKDLADTLRTVTAPLAVSSASAQGSMASNISAAANMTAAATISSAANIATAAATSTSHAVPTPSESVPTYSLATAMPGVSHTSVPSPQSTGNLPSMSFGVSSDSVCHVELITPQQRKDIISGKDINLATLLIPSYHESSQDRHIVMGNEVLPLKPLSDPRTTRALTIQEFIKAFSIYTNEMCIVYPYRRAELDAYMRSIVEMSSRFAGLPFYDYHRGFSARASALLLNHNIKLDWSKVDTKLYCAIFAGQRASTCTLCNSSLHLTAFCPANVAGAASRQTQNKAQNNQSTQNRDRSGRPRIMHDNKEICNSFNSGFCRWPNCHFAHICKTCKKPGHGFSECYSSPTASPKNTTGQNGVLPNAQSGDSSKNVKPSIPKTSSK